MKKLSVKNFWFKLLAAIKRFHFTITFLVGLAILLLMKINDPDVVILDSFWGFFGLGTFLSVSLTLFSENISKMYVRLLLNVGFLTLLAVYCFNLPINLLPYQYYQILILGFVFILSAFFSSFLKKRNDNPFWNFAVNSVTQLFIAYVFALVMLAGLSLAVVSLDQLFGIAIDDKVYGNLAVLCMVVFGPVYFLSNVPDKDAKYNQDISYDRVLKILGLYILVPILTIYTLILYFYLFQIIVKWELPNGWVTTLVSVLSIGGFLTMYILYPLRFSENNRIVNFTSRYFPLLIFPLLILMTVGILRRVDDYGLTINRSYAVLLNLWLIGISIYLFLSKSRHLKWIVITFSLSAFVFSIGPWSLLNVTKNSIQNDIVMLIAEQNLVQNGKVQIDSTHTAQFDAKTSLLISDKMRYLRNNFGRSSVMAIFNDPEDEKALSALISTIGQIETIEDINYFSVNIRKESKLVDIANYSKFFQFSLFDTSKPILKNDTTLIKVDSLCVNIIRSGKINDTLVISLDEKLKLIKKGRNRFSVDELTIENENYKLIINSLSGNIYEENDSVVISSIEGKLFY